MVSFPFPVDSRNILANGKCSARVALELLTDKWTPLVLAILASGPYRFAQLQHMLNGVTQKMLTQSLRKLEREGMISRTVYPTSPPSVEYALTDFGITALEPIGALFEWANIHGPQLPSVQEGIVGA